jgi:hypothetical protein
MLYYHVEVLLLLAMLLLLPLMPMVMWQMLPI